MQHGLSDLEYYQLVLRITGKLYTFAVADGDWCGFENVELAFQLMPEHDPVDEFFDWYCLERVDDQFFATKQDCVLNFLKYWHIWKGQWKDYSKNINLLP